MPAKSKKQQRFFGMVHAYQKGKMKNAPESVKRTAKSISKKDAKDFASTSHSGLPEKKAMQFRMGFLSKCAEYGVPGDLAYKMLKHAQIRQGFGQIGNGLASMGKGVAGLVGGGLLGSASKTEGALAPNKGVMNLATNVGTSARNNLASGARGVWSGMKNIGKGLSSKIKPVVAGIGSTPAPLAYQGR